MELKELFLFQGAEEAAALARDTEVTVFQRGDLILDASCYRKALGVLLSGRAEAVSAAKETAVLSSFRPGSVFGAAGLFGMEQPYGSRVKAVSVCKVQFLPEALLEEIFLRYPQTALNYIAFLSSRVRLLNGKIAVLAQNDVEGRLYRFLAENSDEAGNLHQRINMTRLASTLNMGRTSLYRALESLEKKHLISRKDGKLEVIK